MVKQLIKLFEVVSKKGDHTPTTLVPPRKRFRKIQNINVYWLLLAAFGNVL